MGVRRLQNGRVVFVEARIVEGVPTGLETRKGKEGRGERAKKRRDRGFQGKQKQCYI